MDVVVFDREGCYIIVSKEWVCFGGIFPCVEEFNIIVCWSRFDGVCIPMCFKCFL